MPASKMEPSSPTDPRAQPGSSPEARPRRDQREALTSAAVAIVSAVVALTCASERSLVGVHAAPASSAIVTAAPFSPPPAPAPTPIPVPAVIASSAPPELHAELTSFHEALAELEAGQRSEPVRVLWLGDSHTAADYMTGAVRSALWRRYTPGGPGFVRLGVGLYRHDQASAVRVGRFRVEPVPPARRARQDDGVFGLGGMRATAMAHGATMTLKPSRGTMRGRARYSVMFDLPDGAAFDAALGKSVTRVPRENAGRRVPGSPILRLDLEGTDGDVLEIRATRGRPRFYGATVEGTTPGVVVDTLGINGARIATALSWDEKAFVAEVAERNPSLLLVAYGTNEAFDGADVRAYSGELVRLVARLRTAAPSADCLVVGPPDALEVGGLPAPRVAAINAVYAEASRGIGCAFVNGQELMGGPGSFLAWLTQAPPLSRPDRIHLTPSGYRLLGSRIAAALVDAAGAPPFDAIAAPLNSP